MIQFSETGKVELIKAFVAAQAEMGPVAKDAKNDAFKRDGKASSYATLSSVCDAVIPALNKHGLALIQSTAYEEDFVVVETMIAHTSGGTMSDTLRLRPSKMDPQGIGSTVTYGRKYALMAITGVAPEDDDGNAGSLVGGPPPRRQQEPQSQAREHQPSDEFKMAAQQVRTKVSTEELGDWWNAQKATLKTMMSEQDYAVLIRTVTERRDTLAAAIAPANEQHQQQFDETA